MKEPYKYKTLVADSQFLVAEALEKIVRESEEYIFAGRVSASLELERVLREVHVDILMNADENRNESGDKATLTTAEREIVRLIASGLTTKEIAVKRNVSFHTVMAQRKNIFFKLGVKSISELVVYAMKAGITDNIEYYI